MAAANCRLFGFVADSSGSLAEATVSSPGSTKQRPSEAIDTIRAALKSSFDSRRKILLVTRAIYRAPDASLSLFSTP